MIAQGFSTLKHIWDLQEDIHLCPMPGFLEVKRFHITIYNLKVKDA